MKSLGINIGSSSLKLAVLEDGRIIQSLIRDHEGDFRRTLTTTLAEQGIEPGIPTIATGTEGRFLLNTPNVMETICMEEALAALGEKVDALVSLGGENFVVYTIDDAGKIITSFAGNKCASGTGEFFKQQLGRMDMRLEDVAKVGPEAKVQSLSSRCSVFMKSDCTHKLNKGEATKDDIVVSLSNVMAMKVVDFLKRARIREGRVLLAGGLTRNRYIVGFIQERLPGIRFVVPEQAAWLEAWGAAILAAKNGGPLPVPEKLFKQHEINFGRYKALSSASDKVTYVEPKRDRAKAGREYYLGVDGGSTTTKVALIDAETDGIVAAHYGRTHGDPVKALKECIVEVKKQLAEQIGDGRIRITLAATTGSSREILGVFLETPGVYNEIIAHAVGTTYFKPDIDTIFEIGGQDAKYVNLKNGVPIDYAMNEACSAGTGSFLEESAAGDLGIPDVREIGPVALSAEHPLKFGEHCSAFINSDIRKAIQMGATRADITAGIITSIVSNYLNRVVGNRAIGKNIVLQGGVAKNPAVPLAFALLLDKPITVPPDPELLGCFGVAVLAKQKVKAGLLSTTEYDLDEILSREIRYESEFRCKACSNDCPIRILTVNGHKHMFGGRCNKYANIRHKKEFDESLVFNYVARRDVLLFEEYAPRPESFVRKHNYIVGIPRAFSVYTMWPFYSWFFHSLGIEARLSTGIDPEGIARTEGSYCFPAEIAHGAVQDILNKGYEYIFAPHFKDLESYEDDVHASFCPITQALPYYIRKAFPEIAEERVLSPIVSFKFGKEKAIEGFVDMGRQLGIPEKDVRAAFAVAAERQAAFHRHYKETGVQALSEARAAGRPVIAVLGRPYNAFTRDANMGIPLKFTSRGYAVIPFDMLPFESAEIFDNMYWYYGQQNMKASMMLKKEDNIFVTYITNFSCAPDSFLLHYVKWMMGMKPFLILELDSHSADAGIDTRVEAFLDIIEGYRARFAEIAETRYDNGLRFINNGREPIHIMDENSKKKIDIFGNKKVTLLISSMGKLTAELMAASIRSIGINAEAMPVPDVYTLQLARSHMSGKECLPSQLVLGSALTYFSSPKYKRDELYLLFVPTTTGPCRTGQYFVFYENLFRDMALDNVVVVTLDSDNSYNELGKDFTKGAFWGLTVADYLKDVETSLRTLAVDPQAALATVRASHDRLVKVAESDLSRVVPELRKVTAEIMKIPLKKKLEEAPKVLVVGEIYVRRDDFAVDELIGLFSKKGIIAKVSGTTEWIYYCDHVRRHDIRKRLGMVPWWRRIFSKPLRELFAWKIEHLYKHHVDRKIKHALAPTGLIPPTPHNMDQIMGNAEEHFVHSELYSEISISSGAASTAMFSDYSGIVNIAPFACLIGRVIEGLLTPWSRERRFPVISVEVDGNILPPNMINKLDIFMLNVLRFRANPDAGTFVEQNGPEPEKEETA